MLINTMHRMVYPLLPTFSYGLGVDLSTFSLALTARSAMGVFSPLFAPLSDSKGRKFGMMFGLLLFLMGTGLVVFLPTFPVLFIALILTTTGKVVFDPSVLAYLGDKVSYQRRGQAVAVVELGWSLSFVFGVPLMAFLIARGGWTAPFPWLAGLSLISLIVVVWFLPNSTDPLQESQLLVSIKKILRHPPAVAGLLFGGLISSGNEIINLIFGVWLEESFGLKVLALGAASLMIGLSELMGESLVGGITDRLGKIRAIGGGLLLNTAFALLLPFLGQTLPGALIGLFLFFITFEFTLVSSIPLMTEIMPSSRATFLSVNVAGLSLGRAMAALLAPRIFVWGIFASILAAVSFNLLALIALRKVRFLY